MNTAVSLDDCFNFTKVELATKRLTLVNFRNYKYLRLDLNKPFIVLNGQNGSGKTNILEALSFLSQGRGLRSAKLQDIKTFDFLANTLPSPVYINNNGWSVSAHIQKQDDEFTIGTASETSIKEVDYNETKEIDRRIIHINNKKISSQNELGDYISMIWVTPQMDRLFQGSPQNRRAFLDRIVCSFDTNHSKRLSSFDNLYRQWLHLLKSGNINTNWLNSLEEKISENGIAIAAARKEYIAKLNNFIEQNPDDVFPSAYLELDGTIEKLLDNKPAIFVEDFYRESLFNLRKNILFNSEAPNIIKTDLKAVYSKKNVPANLCSTGEQKSLLLSIILAQAKCLINHRGFPPILLLDEIGAHIDDIKKDALLNKIKNLNTQTWLTTTNMFDFINIKEYAQFFEIKDNKVIEIFK